MAVRMAEHAKVPCEERGHACGQLLAEAVQGSAHELHSRAPVVLSLAVPQLTTEVAAKLSVRRACALTNGCSGSLTMIACAVQTNAIRPHRICADITRLSLRRHCHTWSHC